MRTGPVSPAPRSSAWGRRAAESSFAPPPSRTPRERERTADGEFVALSRPSRRLRWGGVGQANKVSVRLVERAGGGGKVVWEGNSTTRVLQDPAASLATRF